MSITASQREALNAMCPAAGVAALGDVIHRMTNVVTVSGNGWLVDFYALANGERVEIVVDHSSSADFLLVEAPVFEEVDGAIFMVDASGTNGGGFRVYVERVDTGVYNGTDYGYGTGSGDLYYRYARRGLV